MRISSEGKTWSRKRRRNSRIVQGYSQGCPLDDVELELLPTLTAMRLVQSVTLTSNRAKLFPDNTYIVKSQIPVRALLKRLDEGTELAAGIMRS